jgi:hypothetical protein
MEMVDKHYKQMLAALEVEQMSGAVSFSEFPNEYVIILDSLDRISIRFHTIEDTHPAIFVNTK